MLHSIINIVEIKPSVVQYLYGTITQFTVHSNSSSRLKLSAYLEVPYFSYACQPPRPAAGELGKLGKARMMHLASAIPHPTSHPHPAFHIPPSETKLGQSHFRIPLSEIPPAICHTPHATFLKSPNSEIPHRSDPASYIQHPTFCILQTVPHLIVHISHLLLVACMR